MSNNSHKYRLAYGNGAGKIIYLNKQETVRIACKTKQKLVLRMTTNLADLIWVTNKHTVPAGSVTETTILGGRCGPNGQRCTHAQADGDWGCGRQ